jgi:hypothetical protein
MSETVTKVNVPLISTQEAEVLIAALVNHPSRLGDGRENDVVRRLQARVMHAKDILERVEKEKLAQADREVGIA